MSRVDRADVQWRMTPAGRVAHAVRSMRTTGRPWITPLCGEVLSGPDGTDWITPRAGAKECRMCSRRLTAPVPPHPDAQEGTT